MVVAVPVTPETVDIRIISLQAHVDWVFRWLTEIKQEAKRDVRANYVKSGTSEGLIRDLITSCWNTDKELTRENVRKAWRHMWNTPTNLQTGFSWKKAGITIKAFNSHYGDELECVWDQERQQSRPAEGPGTPARTISGRQRLDAAPLQIGV